MARRERAAAALVNSWEDLLLLLSELMRVINLPYATGPISNVYDFTKKTQSVNLLLFLSELSTTSHGVHKQMQYETLVM